MDSNECSSLPLELCEEILCRVPTKSLIRFKLTCKRWFALFNDKRFINKHLALIEEHFIRINSDRKVTIISPMTRACSSFALPYEFQTKPDIYTMIHCDGLLLCILESSAMAVWNPCLNQVRWIKPESSYSINCFYGGIGYNGLSRDGGYKILRFGGNASFTNQYTNTMVDIYELRSNSWKKYEVSLDWHVVTPCRGVSLMGNMYWIAKWNQSGFFIQSFNFSTETFEPLASLPFDYDAHDDVVNLSSFRGTNLSLSQHNKKTEKIDVWVTNISFLIISWTKFFSVTRPDCPVFRAADDLATQVHFIDKNNRVAVCCEEVAVDEKYASVSIYLFGEGEINKEEIELHKRGFSWPYIPGYAYLPSLVPVPT
ncbi:F-box/WD-40 repeat-containing protein 1 [Raphanus sativus]|uniref:F-box/WD-40 repeat-containing protein 1 n=1 Tax=Raphanus sativus TaxID=3726 RepID=A0A6J0NVQ1_RAPSA|nr:F-box/WD-40 repeat-containing protein 1 [Raphanus sativus]XP_056841638.1 F-box/WD-40 repeat-containing protein 1-like [Raphanus sativus]KAJ4897710.1 F-box/WD-40 repeat-containing protein 1 [Raphanus sativus]KAJ4897719.1 F-box/WD-40 repeat-containing protein 1 [Raphanus sativus]